MNKTVLIAGGSGLIGSALNQALLASGYEVRILTRSREAARSKAAFHWDVQSGYVDPLAMEGVGVLINLAGASIAKGRWSKKRKLELWESRIISTNLLLDAVDKGGMRLEAYLGASAVGIYGNTGANIVDESSKPGPSDYLVKLCQAWESAHAGFDRIADKVSVLRIGIVLSNDGGALPVMKKSLLLGLAVSFGNGRQYMPWIHEEDLVRAILFAIERSLGGVINLVTSNPVENLRFARSLVAAYKKFGLVIPVPAIFLQLGMGEMSSILLDGQHVLPSKLLKADFTFLYDRVDAALKALAASDAD